jgi:hypothetical protein
LPSCFGHLSSFSSSASHTFQPGSFQDSTRAFSSFAQARHSLAGIYAYGVSRTFRSFPKSVLRFFEGWYKNTVSLPALIRWYTAARDTGAYIPTPPGDTNRSPGNRAHSESNHSPAFSSGPLRRNFRVSWSGFPTTPKSNLFTSKYGKSVCIMQIEHSKALHSVNSKKQGNRDEQPIPVSPHLRRCGADGSPWAVSAGLRYCPCPYRYAPAFRPCRPTALHISTREERSKTAFLLFRTFHDGLVEGSPSRYTARL